MRLTLKWYLQRTQNILKSIVDFATIVNFLNEKLFSVSQRLKNLKLNVPEIFQIPAKRHLQGFIIFIGHYCGFSKYFGSHLSEDLQYENYFQTSWSVLQVPVVPSSPSGSA